jgi:hypothetical protein
MYNIDKWKPVGMHSLLLYFTVETKQEIIKIF